MLLSSKSLSSSINDFRQDYEIPPTLQGRYYTAVCDQVQVGAMPCACPGCSACPASVNLHLPLQSFAAILDAGAGGLDSPPLARGKVSGGTSSTRGVLPVADFTASAIWLLNALRCVLSPSSMASLTSTFRSKVSSPSRLSTMMRKFAPVSGNLTRAASTWLGKTIRPRMETASSLRPLIAAILGCVRPHEQRSSHQRRERSRLR